ncbi:MAG: RluA family pseudouridine synthase [Myxococcales bacterium]
MTVLWQDDAWVVFDKPSGLLTIPGRRAGEDSLKGAGERLLGRALWTVHRLDRETSGVVAFALTAEAHRALCLAFERREVEKRYLALVAPAPRAEEGRLEDALVPARRGFMRLARPGEKGAVAITSYRVRSRIDGGRALLDVRPETGRMHQIRLQLAEAGCPIVGEPHYRFRQLHAEPAPRLLLHAWTLTLRHPVSGAPLTLEAPPPPELVPPVGPC